MGHDTVTGDTTGGATARVLERSVPVLIKRGEFRGESVASVEQPRVFGGDMTLAELESELRRCTDRWSRFASAVITVERDPDE